MFKILHIEPDSGLQKQLRQWLCHGIVHLTQVTNVTLGMDYILGDMPDLVICGTSLKDQTTLYIKAKFRMLNWDIPLILLTDTLPVEEQATFQRMGIFYIHRVSDGKEALFKSLNEILGTSVLQEKTPFPEQG